MSFREISERMLFSKVKGFTESFEYPPRFPLKRVLIAIITEIIVRVNFYNKLSFYIFFGGYYVRFYYRNTS